MKVALVTSSRYSIAGLLVGQPLPTGIDFVVVLNTSPRRSKLRMLRKVLRVGLFGAIIGYFFRRFYRVDSGDIVDLANAKKIRIIEISGFRPTEEARDLLLKCDIGVSLGNGYIPERFFGLFKHGMVNIHHEVLPRYPGAQSVVWPLIMNENQTGFSIHFITRRIDAGEIVIVKKRPILFKRCFTETVQYNYRESVRLSIVELLALLRIPPEEWERVSNDIQDTFTTPTCTEWIVGALNHRRFRQSYEA